MFSCIIKQSNGCLGLCRTKKTLKDPNEFLFFWRFVAVGTQPFARKWEHATLCALSSGTAGWCLGQQHIKQHPVQSDSSNRTRLVLNSLNVFRLATIHFTVGELKVKWITVAGVHSPVASYLFSPFLVHEYLELEGPTLVNMRIKHLIQVGSIDKAAVLGKICSEYPGYEGKGNFKQIYLLCICMTKSQEQLMEEVRNRFL